MATTQTMDPGLFFEEFMASMREIGKKQAETAEQMKETDRLIERNAQEMEKLKKTVERVTANVGGLNRSRGELIETLIAARLWEKFPEYNLKRAYQRVPIFDENNRTLTDIDILLSNTDTVMAVEVKRELDDKRDVDDHLERMERIRKYPPAEVVGKKIVGAMAGGVVNDDTRRYAYESGFFVLELTGDTVQLIPPPDGFMPKKW
jgi:transcriptional regulator